MEKIVQLIHVNNWFVQYNFEGEHCIVPIDIIALTKDGTIHFLDFDEDGEYCDVTENECFIRLFRLKDDDNT